METIEAPPTMIMGVPSDLSSTQLLRPPLQWADGRWVKIFPEIKWETHPRSLPGAVHGDIKGSFYPRMSLAPLRIILSLDVSGAAKRLCSAPS
jgi:hypothetical protein